MIFNAFIHVYLLPLPMTQTVAQQQTVGVKGESVPRLKAVNRTVSEELLLTITIYFM